MASAEARYIASITRSVGGRPPAALLSTSSVSPTIQVDGGPHADGLSGRCMASMRQDGVMQQPRDFSLYGAVDLGARQAAAQRSQQAASRTAGPDDDPQGGTVLDVTEDTFNVEVVERSRSAPVILDLWAEWCDPCKQLSPVLEKLAIEADGAWVLAKVDIDANPQLRAALQVQSI